MVKHIVLLKLKPATSAPTVAGLERALAGLVGKIDGLQDFVWGPYSSPEGLNKGFTHGFIMTFRDAASRDAYLPHPDHRAAAALVGPAADEVLAFDIVS